MLDFDLECLEMCAKLTLEEKDRRDNDQNQMTSEEESSESDDDDDEELEEKNQQTSKILPEKMECLKLDEIQSNSNSRPKIIELN